MIHYHFTSARHFAGIQKSGIALGMIPWKLNEDGSAKVKRNFQWLTTDPDWEQSWDNPLTTPLNYRRTEYRIALEIPGWASVNTLFKWSDFAQKYRPESTEFLNSLGGSKYWYVFSGPIPTNWFIAVDRNPTEIYIPDATQNN